MEARAQNAHRRGGRHPYWKARRSRAERDSPQEPEQPQQEEGPSEPGPIALFSRVARGEVPARCLSQLPEGFEGDDGSIERCITEKSGVITVHARGKLSSPSLEVGLLRSLEAVLKASPKQEEVIIQDLDLSRNEMTVGFLSAVLGLITRNGAVVQRFRFYGSKHVDDGIMQVLAEYFGRLNSKAAPLELHLSDCRITSDGFNALLQSIKDSAGFPHSDPRTGHSRPLYMRVENNYISKNTIKEWLDSHVVQVITKAGTRRYSGPNRREAKVHLLVFESGFCPQKSELPPSQAVRVEEDHLYGPEDGHLEEEAAEDAQAEVESPRVKAKAKAKAKAEVPKPKEKAGHSKTWVKVGASASGEAPSSSGEAPARKTEEAAEESGAMVAASSTGSEGGRPSVKDSRRPDATDTSRGSLQHDAADSRRPDAADTSRGSPEHSAAAAGKTLSGTAAPPLGWPRGVAPSSIPVPFQRPRRVGPAGPAADWPAGTTEPCQPGKLMAGPMKAPQGRLLGGASLAAAVGVPLAKESRGPLGPGKAHGHEFRQAHADRSPPKRSAAEVRIEAILEHMDRLREALAALRACPQPQAEGACLHQAGGPAAAQNGTAQRGTAASSSDARDLHSSGLEEALNLMKTSTVVQRCQDVEETWRGHLEASEKPVNEAQRLLSMADCLKKQGFLPSSPTLPPSAEAPGVAESPDGAELSRLPPGQQVLTWRL